MYRKCRTAFGYSQDTCQQDLSTIHDGWQCAPESGDTILVLNSFFLASFSGLVHPQRNRKNGESSNRKGFIYRTGNFKSPKKKDDLPK